MAFLGAAKRKLVWSQTARALVRSSQRVCLAAVAGAARRAGLAAHLPVVERDCAATLIPQSLPGGTGGSSCE